MKTKFLVYCAMLLLALFRKSCSMVGPFRVVATELGF